VAQALGCYQTDIKMNEPKREQENPEGVPGMSSPATKSENP
jgi:hypothetical protein